MNRTYLYPKWFCTFLILLCGLNMNAQMELEYWFDKYSDPQTLPMNFSEGTIKPSLNSDKLPHGLHTVYFRVKNGDTYSPVSSSTFFKFTGDGVSKIEYWFEDDVTNKGTTEFDANTEEMQELFLDLSDSDIFPFGVHQLNMRVAIDGGFYSPVYSALVLRMPSGSENSLLEYWFDDDMSKMATIPVDIEKGDVQKLDLDLTNTDYFPSGFHKLNMRVAANENQHSPIYSAYVMRLPDGSKSQISYWLDDDYKNQRIVTSRISNGVTSVFMPTLDFSSATSGMHRLKFRITSNGFDDGVIYETPVLVTRRYNNDNLANVTIVTEHHWYDDFYNPQRTIANPQSTYTVSYDLEPALFTGYSEGQHEFHVQFKNSAEVWSAENITYFYKDATGRLRVGKQDSEADGIKEIEVYNEIGFNSGTIFVDCQSPELASTGVVIVSDLSGKILAKEVVNNLNGIHAEISVQGHDKQILVVKVISGGFQYYKKLMIK